MQICAIWCILGHDFCIFIGQKMSSIYIKMFQNINNLQKCSIASCYRYVSDKILCVSVKLYWNWSDGVAIRGANCSPKSLLKIFRMAKAEPRSAAGGFTDSNAENRIEKDQIQHKLKSFGLERSKWWTAKLNVRVIPIGNGNGIFSPKPKSRTLKE